MPQLCGYGGTGGAFDRVTSLVGLKNRIHLNRWLGDAVEGVLVRKRHALMPVLARSAGLELDRRFRDMAWSVVTL